MSEIGYGSIFRPLFQPSVGDPVQQAPAVVSATILPDGVTLRLVFDSPVLTGTATLGMSRSISSIASGVISGGVVVLTIPEEYFGNDAGTISYNASTGNLAGEFGDVPSFSGLAIINRTTETDYLVDNSGNNLVDNDGNYLVWSI